MATSEMLSVLVEAELLERVKAAAARDRRSVSGYVRNLLADNLTTKPSPPHQGTAA